jgi:hypothetical protein
MTEYCVFHSAAHAVKQGFNACVFNDLTADHYDRQWGWMKPLFQEAGISTSDCRRSKLIPERKNLLLTRRHSNPYNPSFLSKTTGFP